MNAKPWDLLNTDNYVSEEVYDERYNICQKCEFLFTPTKTCKKCGCFMFLKCAVNTAKCPIDKW